MKDNPYNHMEHPKDVVDTDNCAACIWNQGKAAALPDRDRLGLFIYHHRHFFQEQNEGGLADAILNEFYKGDA